MVFTQNLGLTLIFPLAEQSGAVFVSAQGFLLDCALEYSERIASTIKIKKSEITTAMVLSRSIDLAVSKR